MPTLPPLAAPAPQFIARQRAKQQRAPPELSARVVACTHSQLYSNAFSTDVDNVDTVDSVPQKLRQPPPCCAPRWQPCPPDKDVRQFRDVLQVEGQTLLAGTGYWFRELKEVLDPAGLILKGTPEADTISLGGAIATSAHGSGLYQQQCSAYILEMWIINAAGEEIMIKKDDKDFPAAVVSLGLLGAITKVRMQCFAPTKNRKITSSYTETYSGSEINDIDRDHTASFRFAPYWKKMIRTNETETEESQDLCYNALNKIAAVPSLAYTLDTSLICCPFIARLSSQILVMSGTKVADKLTTFSATPSVRAMDLEYAVDYADAPACFDDLMVVVEANAKKGHYVTYQFWMRLLGAVDKSWVLALSAGGDKAVFEFIISDNQAGGPEFADELVEVFKKYSGRPHLGKTIRPQDAEYTGKVYGSTAGGAPFRAFEKTRKKYDPDGKFLNKNLRVFLDAAKQASGAK